jgi:hypothetical protein
MKDLLVRDYQSILWRVKEIIEKIWKTLKFSSQEEGQAVITLACHVLLDFWVYLIPFFKESFISINLLYRCVVKKKI